MEVLINILRRKNLLELVGYLIWWNLDDHLGFVHYNFFTTLAFSSQLSLFRHHFSHYYRANGLHFKLKPHLYMTYFVASSHYVIGTLRPRLHDVEVRPTIGSPPEIQRC